MKTIVTAPSPSSCPISDSGLFQMCSLQDTAALEAAKNIARVNLGHAGTGLDRDFPRLLRPEEIQGSVVHAIVLS